MKKIILPAFVATATVAGFYTLTIFYEGADLLLLPLVVILGLVGLFGIITIPFFIFLIVKKRPGGRVLIWVTGLALGTYLGFIAVTPLINWDRDHRDLSGKLISIEIENYKAIHEQYPENLNELNTELLNDVLPSTYQLKRFSYRRTDDYYDLDIPGLTLLHWNTKTGNWEPQ